MTARRQEEDRMLTRLRGDSAALIEVLGRLLDEGMTRDELVIFAHANAPENVAVHRIVMALDALIRERRQNRP